LRIAHKEMQIWQWIEATPDLTLVKLSQRLAEEGIQTKVPALWHQLNIATLYRNGPVSTVLSVVAK